MAKRLQFQFQYVGSPKSKNTNSVATTSIKTEDNREYVLPQDMRFVREHKELTKTNMYTRVKKRFTQGGQTRTVWITLTQEMEQIYFDEESNIMFNDTYFEQIEETKIIKSTQKEENILDLSKRQKDLW